MFYYATATYKNKKFFFIVDANKQRIMNGITKIVIPPSELKDLEVYAKVPFLSN